MYPFIRGLSDMQLPKIFANPFLPLARAIHLRMLQKELQKCLQVAHKL
jgi:hypothetical protein